MSATRARHPRLGRLLAAPGLPRPHLRGWRPSGAVIAIVAGLIVVLGCGWLWFRDSSLVSVNRVRVTGLSGPDVPQIRAALKNAGLTMTTLDVNMGQLESVVEPYPDVRALSVDTQFPHGLVIHVEEEIPVAELSVGGRTLAVSGDGSLLRAPRTSDGRLPALPANAELAAGRVAGAGSRAVLAALAAAPFRLLAHMAGAHPSSAHGVVVALRNGPSLYLGPPTDLRAKWAAAVAVLGDAQSKGAQYIDVTDPQHPAAGAVASAATSASTSGATSASG